MENSWNPERERVKQYKESIGWKKWGPYLTERQWGTVREDYSASGSAWEFVSHDMARSRAYRWGKKALQAFQIINHYFVLLLHSGMVKIRY